MVGDLWAGCYGDVHSVMTPPTITGTTIMGYDVQIGWGKSVPLPPHPIYTPPNMEEEKSSKVPDPPSGLPFNAQARKTQSSGSKYGNVPPPGAAQDDDEEDFDKVTT